MEKGPSGMGMGRREFLKKLGGALAGTAIAGSALAKEIGKSNNNLETNEVSETITNTERVVNELFEGRELTPNQGKEFLEKVEYWYKQHSEGGANHESLKIGWDRLLDIKNKKQSDLELISEIFKKNGVPKDLVFLALAESYWNKNAYNKGSQAGGPWQFIPDTAKRFNVKNVYEIRESTEAACKYLKWLKNLAEKCAKEAGATVSDSDLWSWAFLAYNRGEGYVLQRPSGKQGDFFDFQGDINEYVKNCKVKESINYPTKILGIAKALEKMVTPSDEYSAFLKKDNS